MKKSKKTEENPFVKPLNKIKALYSSEDEWQDELDRYIHFTESKSFVDLLHDAEGPFPVYHGKNHIIKVIKNADTLFDDKCKKRFEVEDVFNLLVAVCIHDLPMIHMIQTGASGELADMKRGSHADENELKKIIDKYGLIDSYDIERQEYIIKLASAHANDHDKTVEQKIADYSDNFDDPEDKNKWRALVRVICIADYLDIGVNRLRPVADDLTWVNGQYDHYRKHKYLKSPIIRYKKIKISLRLPATNDVKNVKLELKERLEILTILQKVYYELERQVKNLNEALETQWTLTPLNEDFFGRIFPLSYGMQLFTIIFEEAYNKKTDGELFEIDMLGHSLFARFVDDSEGLNDRLQQILKKGQTQFRVLLLDPEIELQQSCEIFDSQISKEKEKDRYILPSYDQKFDLLEKGKGDIYSSLDKIKSDWLDVGEHSTFKVKLTKKILYAGIIRFGNYLVVTPYTMGLSRQSISIVYSKVSPIYDAILKDFESLWNKTDDTRLYVSKTGSNVKEDNPIKEIIPFVYQPGNGSNFNYETWLLSDEFKHRIKFWFENEDEVIPPYEVEIQPTNSCNLNCSHCIGRHLEYFELEKKNLKPSSVKSIIQFLGWTGKGFKIERIRISGLNGDPLANDAIEFTKELINANEAELKKDIVLFTNGINIDQALDVLPKINSIHISIDAGTEKSFYEIKNSDNFLKIFENIDLLTEARKAHKSNLKIGIGFVVTQRNHLEVEAIFEKAIKSGVDFIRYKRDIHMPNSISWRTWIETRHKIEELINSDHAKPRVFITDLPRRHWDGNTKKCISYKFCLTIGADGNIFTCDHLTNKADTAVVNLSDENLIEKVIKNLKDKKHLNNLNKCPQCPPFNYRLNYFIPQLESIYSQGNWDDLDKKITTYFDELEKPRRLL